MPAYTPVMTVWVLVACWRPDPSLALDLPPLEAIEPEVAAGEAAAGEEAAGEVEVAPEGPEPPEVPFEAWAGVTLTAPLTLVDEAGKPLAVFEAPGVTVQVRGDDGARLKVYCPTCEPPAEGYLQGAAVGRP
jgi:hypothetical protein